MRRKKLLEITLCAVLTIGALLCCMQDASARETLLISGNADLYPIESYDRGRECYVGLLPELYERLSEQTGYDLVYLPYSKNTTQAQQTANRQADIISAYPSGTVDSGAMRRQVLLCTIEHDGAERAIYVGFTNALTPELAGALAQALEDLSGAESIGVLADYTNSSGAEAYRTRWLITLAALIAAMLAAAVALIVFARKKRAEQKTNALIDPRYGIGNDRYYLHCMETLHPRPAQKHRLCHLHRLRYALARTALWRGGARGDLLPRGGVSAPWLRTRGIPRLRGARDVRARVSVRQPRGGTAARRGAYPRAGRLPCGLPRRICRRVPRGHLLAVGKPRLRRRGCALQRAPGLCPRVPHGNALRVQHARHDRRERAARASARQHEQGGGKGRI